MTIKRLLEQCFPYGSTEHHYLPPHREVRVSNEGFIEAVKKLFQRKKGKPVDEKAPTPTREQLPSPWQWLDEELSRKNPNDLTVKPDIVTIPVTYAPFFMRNGKPVADVVSEVQKDLKAYRQLISQYKSKWVAFNRFITKADEELKKFQRTDPEATKPEEFYALLKRIALRCPPPLINSFKEPTHKFLGFESDRFTRTRPAYRAFGREMPASLEFVTESSKDKAGQEIEVVLADEKQVRVFVALIKDVVKLFLELEMYYDEENTPILDSSDQPFRAYRDMIPDDWDNTIVTFLHPDDYRLHIGLVHCIYHRVSALVEALGYAGRKWTGGEHS